MLRAHRELTYPMRKLLTLLSHTRRAVARHGLIGTLRRGIVRLRGQQERSDFDREHGTDTSGIVPLWRTSVDPKMAATGENYQAADAAVVTAVIGHTGVEPERFTFIDLGCGKGLPLLVAGRAGFRRVIGVEFAPELAETARANLRLLGIAQGEVVTGDAGAFGFPSGPLLVFFYNSFQPEVLTRVFANLRARAGEEVHFVYLNPQHGDFVAAQAGLVEYPAGGLTPRTRFWRLAPPNA